MNPVDEVISKLETIVETCRRERSRAGYFAAMYLTVTRQIKTAIEAGTFQDGPRMAQLDAVFAQRYIDAFHQDRNGTSPTRSWQRSFEGTNSRRPIIVQQLLTGMNAHINLDLGIAAATIAPGDELATLKPDFDAINTLLAGMTERMTDDVAAVSPWIGLLDKIGGSTEQAVIRFSIDVARDEAWKLASDLAPRPPDQWAALIEARDQFAADLTHLILHPGWLLSTGLLVIRLRESNNIASVMNSLNH